MSVCPCCLSGQRFKKYSTKAANTLISPFPKGAVKLSPSMPRFPSRLIKEEIALEEAMMTKGLLIIQRPLYRAHILHKKHSQCVYIKLAVPAKDKQRLPTRAHG